MPVSLKKQGSGYLSWGFFGSSLLEDRMLDQLTSSGLTLRDAMLEKDFKISMGLSVPEPILQLEM